MNVVGLDLSLTGTAWSAGPERIGRWDTPADKISGTRRLRYLRDVVADRLWIEAPSMVLLEGYSYASPQGAHQMGELGGIVRLLLDDMALPWATVTPQNRSKLVTGSSSSKKAAVVSALASRTGLTFATDDHADAFAIWCMAREGYSQEHPLQPLPKANLAAMVTVDWPTVGEWVPAYEYKPQPHKKPKKAAA